VAVSGLQVLVFGGIWLAWGLFCLSLGYAGAFVEVQQMIASLPTQVQNTVRAALWFTSQAGNTAVLVPGLVWVYVPQRCQLNHLLVIWLACGVFTQVLKHTLFADWPRPGATFAHEAWFYMHPIETALHHSMPSGHALAYAALVGSVVLTGQAKRGSGWFLGGLGVTVGLSRVVLGVHYPADVWVGWTLGLTLAALLATFRLLRLHPVLNTIPGFILHTVLVLTFVIGLAALVSRCLTSGLI
jgi:membrane-associated phospholipid phosphatase